MKRNPKKAVIISFVCVTVAAALVIVCVKFINLHKTNAELEERKERLEELIEEQEERTAALEDEAEYVKTQEYIEEKARSIGYVYPDEIIFRRSEE